MTRKSVVAARKRRKRKNRPEKVRAESCGLVRESQKASARAFQERVRPGAGMADTRGLGSR